MTLSHEAMLDLMAYADGELEGEALARVETLIAETPEAARFVGDLGTLGDCVRVAAGARRVPKTVDFIADDVMKQVARMPRLIVNDDPKPVRMRRAIAAGAVSAVVAMAAGWALFFRGNEAQNFVQHQQQMLASATPQQHPSATAPVAPEPPSAGVDLDQVESKNEVSVFYLPSEANANVSSVVVWIDDKGGTP